MVDFGFISIYLLLDLFKNLIFSFDIIITSIRAAVAKKEHK